MNTMVTERPPAHSPQRTPGAGVPNQSANLPSVMIYAPHLLPPEQHYVREHAARLRRYRPVLAGRRHVGGFLRDDFPTFTFDNGASGRLHEACFLLTGRENRIESFVRHHRIRLIHAHFGPGGTEIMSVAARYGIPLVVTFHGWDAKLGAEKLVHVTRYERIYRKRLPRLLRQARAVICVSNAWHERLIELGCPPEKLRTRYLGVDSTFFDGAREDFDPASILFVGRLIRRKGVHTLLEAMVLLRERQVDASLTVAGDGPEMERLRAMAAERNLPVRFLGMISHAEIRALLRRSSVLCVPSTTAGAEVPEALGLVLLEAQAMSIPAVATRNGGIPEAIEDGRTGLLVDQDAPDQLADALATMIRDKALNRSFGEAARRRVCEHFDIARGYAAMEELYDDILEDHRP